jgi:hypothetical protein
MTVIVNFNVRNPEWYWSAEEIKEADSYYEEWKALNADKIPKHIPTWAYKIAFDVVDVSENRNATCELEFRDSQDHQIVRSFIAEDMTHVVFTSKQGEKAEVRISNEIMHSFMGAKQSGRKYYWYFFIKEDAKFERLEDTIWLSQRQFLLLQESLSIVGNL